MGEYLKPKSAFGTFLLKGEYLERFDIRCFAKNLQQGAYVSNYNGYYIKSRDYYNKHYYDKLPRAVRFNISESKFVGIKFSFDCWYDYDTDLNEIYKDYCEEFFRSAFISKKVQNFYNKLKKDYPELFI